MAYRTRMVPVLGVMLATAWACDSATPTEAPIEEVSAGDPVAGRITFERECGSCHASGDGFDLSFFGYPDSTIVRRALGHVNEDDAEDVVAWVRTLGASGAERTTRLFQPGGVVLADDRAFAVALLGADAWPASLDADALAGVDLLDVPIALRLPMWSTEGASTDWMPDQPVGREILDFGGAGAAVAAWRADHRDGALLLAVGRLRAASRDAANPGAPCTFGGERPVEWERCFEVQRWIASLGALHMLREGLEDGIDPVVHDAFWDVGQTVRRSIVTGGLDPEDGALRSAVSRTPGSTAPFVDVRNASRFAPDHWSVDVARFGLDHLADRLESGVPLRLRADESVAELVEDVERTWEIAAARDPGAAGELAALRDRVVGLLEEAPTVRVEA